MISSPKGLRAISRLFEERRTHILWWWSELNGFAGRRTQGRNFPGKSEREAESIERQF